MYSVFQHRFESVWIVITWLYLGVLEIVMDVKELSEGRFRRADNNRAALLGLVAQCLGDDFIELLDGTAPSEQRLDCASWITPREQEALEPQIEKLRKDLEERLAALGLNAVIYIASDSALSEEQGRIRARLYGDEGKVRPLRG
jgi:hypothetical protein